MGTGRDEILGVVEGFLGRECDVSLQMRRPRFRGGLSSEDEVHDGLGELYSESS